MSRAQPRLHHIVPGKWHVRHSFRSCSRIELGQKSAFMPLGPKAIDSLRRLQEMAHAKWSPANIDSETEGLANSSDLTETISWLEENRIKRALKVLDIPVWKLDRDLYIDELKDSIDILNDMEKATAFLAYSGTGLPYIESIRESILHRMSAYDQALLLDAEELLREAGDNTAIAEDDRQSLEEFKKVVEIAKVLSSWFQKEKIEITVHKEAVSDEEVKQSLEGYVAGGALESLRSSLKKKPIVRVSNRRIEWGTMKIVRPPLEQRPASRKKTWKQVPLDRGVIMKQPHRLITDKKIFTDKRKEQRGTLLIDVSGSMTVSEKELDRLLDIAPLLTIALYTSEFYYYFSGLLIIVASRERRCSAKYLTKYTGYGNVVDGPALRWLAKQEHPRIWVSDGIVTGIGDLNHPNLSREAYSIARNANILRVSQVSDVIDWFLYKKTLKRL